MEMKSPQSFKAMGKIFLKHSATPQKTVIINNTAVTTLNFAF
jgi:hypothetical protein